MKTLDQQFIDWHARMFGENSPHMLSLCDTAFRAGAAAMAEQLFSGDHARMLQVGESTWCLVGNIVAVTPVRTGDRVPDDRLFYKSRILLTDDNALYSTLTPAEVAAIIQGPKP